MNQNLLLILRVWPFTCVGFRVCGLTWTTSSGCRSFRSSSQIPGDLCFFSKWFQNAMISPKYYWYTPLHLCWFYCLWVDYSVCERIADCCRRWADYPSWWYHQQHQAVWYGRFLHQDERRACCIRDKSASLPFLQWLISVVDRFARHLGSWIDIFVQLQLFHQLVQDYQLLVQVLDSLVFRSIGSSDWIVCSFAVEQA